jgi:GH25 family lysozyme M1 (1,4-beta-N-acetylmuramidase)
MQRLRRRRSLWIVAVAAGGLMGPVAWSSARAAVPSAARDSGRFSLPQEAALAQGRLAANLAEPHPGQPETLSHPSSDHAGSTTPGPTVGLPILPGLSEPGLDVSSYQGNVDWQQVAANGGTFAYIKATEGTYYVDSTYFAEQYNGSYAAGLERGAYHFGIPNNSSGAAQADFFVARGGGWTRDGRTLPGMLDVEYNPYGPECYGLTPAQMVAWIASFEGEYQYLTGRYAAIYTTTNWWRACTGNTGGFGSAPLIIANYGSSPFPLPASWDHYDVWQYSDRGVFPGDQDSFAGSRVDLIGFALGIMQ